jgi:uncharacterized RDD family membrane protein YckC
MESSQSQFSEETLPNDIYAGFWSRIGSSLLDGLLMIPVTALLLYMNSLGVDFAYATAPIGIFFTAWYHIYLVKTYGATPGKLAAGIKIVKTNGLDIDWNEALLRHVVMLLLGIFSVGVTIYALEQVDPTKYESMTWYAQPLYLSTFAPAAFTVYSWGSNVWFYSEFIVLLTNKERRAIHDFMAGTVVVKTDSLNAFRNVRPQEPRNDIKELGTVV